MPDAGRLSEHRLSMIVERWDPVVRCASTRCAWRALSLDFFAACSALALTVCFFTGTALKPLRGTEGRVTQSAGAGQPLKMWLTDSVRLC